MILAELTNTTPPLDINKIIISIVGYAASATTIITLVKLWFTNRKSSVTIEGLNKEDQKKLTSIVTHYDTLIERIEKIENELEGGTNLDRIAKELEQVRKEANEDRMFLMNLMKDLLNLKR